MDYFELVSVFVLIAFSFYGLFIVLSKPYRISTKNSYPAKLSVRQLGVLEGSFKELKEVIVIADMIEEPKGTLYESVCKNFSNNVEYTFLISKQNYENERSSYYKIFEMIAAIKNKKALVHIYPLNTQWNDYPCVFYRTQNDHETFSTIAYMGTQVKEGIANDYELLSPTIAVKIYKLANAALHTDIKKNINVDEFQKLPNIVSSLTIEPN